MWHARCSAQLTLKLDRLYKCYNWVNIMLYAAGVIKFLSLFSVLIVSHTYTLIQYGLHSVVNIVSTDAVHYSNVFVLCRTMMYHRIGYCSYLCCVRNLVSTMWLTPSLKWRSLRQLLILVSTNNITYCPALEIMEIDILGPMLKKIKMCIYC